MLREEVLELVIELGGERLVVRQDQRRPIQLLDDLGHREGLAGSGNAKQNLVLFAFVDTPGKRRDGRGLIATGGVVGMEFKVHKKAVSK